MARHAARLRVSARHEGRGLEHRAGASGALQHDDDAQVRAFDTREENEGRRDAVRRFIEKPSLFA